MRQSWCVCLTMANLCAGFCTVAVGHEPLRTNGQYQAERVEVRTYPVADLVVPLPGPSPTPGARFDKTCEREIAALEQHLRRVTGIDAWQQEGTSIKPYAKTLSLVIRQTPRTHEKIADEISRLRSELDVQAALEIRVISGPRDQIAALAEAFPGELGQFETEQLLKQANEIESLNTVLSPKITLFSRQTAHVIFDGRTLAVNAVVSADRRSVQLKALDTSQSDADVLRQLEVVQIHSGRSVALRFEAPPLGAIIPPAPDASERLVVITPRVIVVTEEEQTVLMVTPRGGIQEEEEELLGIPNE